MVAKVNGRVSSGEALGRDLQFYTVVFTGHDIRSIADGGDATSQGKLDKVIEIVAMCGQPVIISSVAYASSNSTLKFAVEHKHAWVDPTYTASKADADLVTSAQTYLAAQIVAHTPTAWSFASDVAVTISDTI
jgi:hypothetical protein